MVMIEKVPGKSEEDLKDEIIEKYTGSDLIQKCRTLDFEEFKEEFLN